MSSCEECCEVTGWPEGHYTLASGKSIRVSCPCDCHSETKKEEGDMTNTNNEATSTYDWRRGADKLFALTPIVQTNGIGVGAAYQDEAGYNATTYGPFETWDNAKEFCDNFNTKLGMTQDEADAIIVSSMRAQNEARLIARAPQLLKIVEFLGEWVKAGADNISLSALVSQDDGGLYVGDYTLADAVWDALKKED